MQQARAGKSLKGFQQPWRATPVHPGRRTVCNVAAFAPSSKELRGQRNWKGLLPEGRNNKINTELARMILTYGDLTQVAYDNFTTSGPLETNKPPCSCHPVASNPPKTAFLLNTAVYGYPFNWVSEADAQRHQQPPALPIFLEACKSDARKYQGVKDIFAYAGLFNIKANMEADVQDELRDIDKKYLRRLLPHWQGYVAYAPPQDSNDEGELVFCFRGTERADEWWTNLLGAAGAEDFDPRNKGLGKVHRGFLHMYGARVTHPAEDNDPVDPDVLMDPMQVVEKVLAPYIEAYKSDGKPLPRITITGHSLGGALATLCAMHVATHLEAKAGRQADVTAVTFSAPRVGNDVFGDALESKGVKLLRIYNKQDVVPRLPPQGALDLADAVHDARDQYPEQQNFIEWAADSLLKWTERKKQEELQYVDMGVELALDYQPLRSAEPNLIKWPLSAGDHHNLELNLHIIGRMAKDPIVRDYALMNKGNDMLSPDLSIPAAWWDLYYPKRAAGQEVMQLTAAGEFRPVPKPKL